LPRTEWDQRRLEQIRQAHGGVLPAEYDPANFPDQLTSYTDILDTDPVTINGVTRKGGYVPTSGKRLDPHKVEELRGAP
jgi:hypothetical protein